MVKLNAVQGLRWGVGQLRIAVRQNKSDKKKNKNKKTAVSLIQLSEKFDNASPPFPQSPPDR